MAYPYLPDMGNCDAPAIECGYLDPSIETPMENGMVITRPRYKRVRRTFKVPYRLVSQAACDDLRDFIRKTVVGGSGVFVWRNPTTDEEIKVRFAKDNLPKPIEVAMAKQIVYSFELQLEEV